MANRDNSEALRLRDGYDKLKPCIMRNLGKLPKNLVYHNTIHTQDVIDSFERLALLKGVGKRDYWIGKTAALLHDTGYIFEPVGKGHEERGAHFAENLLRNRGYKLSDIFTVSGMIRATTIPQNPKTLLDALLCDSDLDNLGREDCLDKGDLLRQELESMGIKMSDLKWYEGELKFMQDNGYHTDSAKYLRNGKKKENMERLRGIIESLKK
jgi:hypothetical protein